MKQNRPWVISFLLLFWLLAGGAASAQQKAVKILAIGNSFSQDAVEQYLHELADAEGIPAIIGNLYIGGCSLERHVKNARDNAPAYAYRKIGLDGKKVEKKKTSLDIALADEEWDYVSLQQVSSLSGLYDTYEASLPELVKYVRARLPEKTKLMLHQTWAYAATTTHSGFKNYGRDQLTMYHAIVDAVQKASALLKIKMIIPSGTAIQNARTSFVGDRMNRDGYHLDVKIGRYTAACTWFEKIFGRNVVGNPYYPQGMTSAQREVAQQAAHEAVQSPTRITELTEWKDPATQEINLSGKWAFQTDVMDFRRGSLDVRYMHRLQESIVLPGITDDYKIGYKSPYRHIDRLTRVYEYMAPAWYQREITIPEEWKGKRIFLYFERTHWLSSIYVDTKEVSKIDYVSVPHNHELTDFVKPGKTHLMTVCIDNRYQYDTHKWDHAHSEFTQINWNGILGEIKLMAVDPVYMEDMQLYPNLPERSVKVKMKIRNHTHGPVSGKALFTVSGEQYKLNKEITVSGSDSILYVEEVIALGKDIRLWDEFTPHLYTLNCCLATTADGKNYRHSRSATFGMREIKADKDKLLINGRRLHLRGTVENAVFPKTGYAPVDDASWKRVLTILKDYGMNHIRFHSWCPPAAAFRMADKLGVYLEVEMPMWGKDAEPDEARYNFFRREQKAILKEYGNHPSFILYCNGNEITGNFDFIEELTHYGRTNDNRRLFSGSTARTRVKSDQFYITHQTPKGHTAIYEGRPYTDWDKNKELGIDVPVISHESGQRCIYPNFKEIPNFTGPVQARNFEVYRDSLEAHGMLDQADDFYQVSGAQTVLEYKDVIEAQLRTHLKSGFQLLSLNDFTGQGYAPVGILDPFWNSKGLITPGKFREFCAPTVALLRFPKRSYYAGEVFAGKAEVYNYSPSAFKNARLKWWVTDADGKVLKTGKLKTQTIGNNGVFPAGEFSYELPDITAPQKLTVHLSVDNAIRNSWDIWVYPRRDLKDLMHSTVDVLYTTVYDAKARQYLDEGKKVVLCPLPAKVKGRSSTFHNHFWNPIMFKWKPMTLGCLIHADQKMFDHFITEKHLDWQWWDILTHAKVIEMGEAPRALRPFIQVIDSYETNHKLGIGFEAKVRNGKLMVLAVDTKKDIENRPATQQLLVSIDRYVKSGQFDPRVEVEESFIESFLRK